MPKGYIIARIDVHDPETYKTYVELTKPAFEKYGAKPLVRGGRAESLEGQGRTRNVVLEFDSYERARDYFHSPEYQKAAEYRRKASTGELILVEGA